MVDFDELDTGLMLARWSVPLPSDRQPLTPTEEAEKLDRRVFVTCIFTFPVNLQSPGRGRPIHWWNDEIVVSRTECVSAGETGGSPRHKYLPQKLREYQRATQPTTAVRGGFRPLKSLYSPIDPTGP